MCGGFAAAQKKRERKAEIWRHHKRNKELIRAKRLLTEKNIVTEDVKQWKINKMNDPWAFNPFYDPNAKVRYAYGELLDVSGTISITCIPSSCPT